jgi:squalene synthase HpnC
VTVDEAFAVCEAQARAHYENFPVGLFVPRDRQRYVHAVYAYARTADDFADEPAFEGQRTERLDEWEERLHAAYRGEADHPVFIALGETVRRLGIPKEPLLDLLSAFRQDTWKRRYASWEELLDYSRRSADPVGRLVLLLFGYDDETLRPQSDAICSGLQLANHWQDVAVDWRKDRVYLPADLMARHGVTEADLAQAVVTDRFRALMAELVARTRALFAAGRPLCDRVGRDLRFEMRLTWLGGTGILDRVEAAGYDVFRRRPSYGMGGKLGLAYRALRWS